MELRYKQVVEHNINQLRVQFFCIQDDNGCN